MQCIRRLATCIVLALAFAACGGGGDGGEQPVDVTATGRVVLGFLAGATVQVYDTRDLTTPIAATTTSGGPTHDEVGFFEVLLPDVLSGELFLFVVTGGDALDLDADGVLDPVPTPNLGAVHGLASGGQLGDGPILLSVVSEIAYQRSRYHLAAEYDADSVRRTFPTWAQTLLGESADGDGDVDPDDLLAFDPRTDRSRLLRTWPAFEALREDLVDGHDVTADALALGDSQIAYLDLTGSTTDVAVVGDRAYVCRGEIGLAIYDLSDPAAPSLRGTYDSPGAAWRVQVVGSLAYVADLSGGLQIVDVSDDTLPVSAGAVPIDDAVDLEVVGDLAFVTEAGTPRLHVVDVSAAASATVLGSEDLESSAVHDLAAYGDLVYVRGPIGIEIVDVSTPAMPTSLGTTETVGAYGRLLVRGPWLYVAAGDQVETFDLSVPSDPDPVGTTSLPPSGGSPGDIEDLGDGRLAVALSFRGIAMMDVTGSPLPSYLGTLQVSGGAGTVAGGVGVLVSTEVNGGLHVHAAATPPPSAEVASIDVPTPSALDVVGVRGALVVRDGGVVRLQVLDLSDPERPDPRGAVDLTIASPQVVLLAGSFAYVGGSALEVVDLSNPDLPFVAGGLPTSGTVSGLALDSDVLYGVAGGDGLRLFDVGTPASPTAIATLDTPGQARDAAYDLGVLVLADGFQGLRTYDAAVPSAPVHELTLPLQQAVGLAARSGWTFLARFAGTGSGALEVVDHDPADAATNVATLPLRSNPEGVDLAGDHAYLKVGGAVEVVDLVMPLSPVHAATLGLPAGLGTLDLVAAGQHLYVAGSRGRLLVLRAARRSVP